MKRVSCIIGSFAVFFDFSSSSLALFLTASSSLALFLFSFSFIQFPVPRSSGLVGRSRFYS